MQEGAYMLKIFIIFCILFCALVKSYNRGYTKGYIDGIKRNQEEGEIHD